MESGWQTVWQHTYTVGKIVFAIGTILTTIGRTGLWWHLKSKETVASERPSMPLNQPSKNLAITQHHTGTGDNVGRDKYEYHFDTVPPVLHTKDESSSILPDGSYKISRTMEMNAPYAGNLSITVKARGLVKAEVGQAARSVTLPNGSVMTLSGGGIFGTTIEADDFFSTTIPSPAGRYVITAITKSKTAINIETKFQ